MKSIEYRSGGKRREREGEREREQNDATKENNRDQR
jgi:hypothetical protein